MKEYLLFIDTETSGMPVLWNRPYTDRNNWPQVVQVAWIICDRDGKEIKRVNKYIYEESIHISGESYQVHGITKDYIKEFGERRKNVLRKLAYDIKKFQPLIVGHFIEFDIHVLSADYARARLDNPFGSSNLFCTMLESKKFVLNPVARYLRLSQLHEHLFNEIPLKLHEAETDAALTLKCFFELLHRKEIPSEDFVLQQQQLEKKLHFVYHHIA